MSSFEDFSRLSRLALLGAFVALSLPLSGARAAEAQDEDEMIDTRIMRGLLEGLGLQRDGAGIDYRERSPLVVPPGRQLPPPETVSAAASNPAWPADPDEKLRKESKRKTSGPVDEDRPLSPGQLRRNSAARGSQQAAVGRGDPGGTEGRPLRPDELNPGGKSIWNMFSKKEEVVTFTGEPPRTSLLAPPPGYQTPSPNAPYGITSLPTIKPENPMDRGTK